MKKERSNIIICMLLMALLLCGCGSKANENTQNENSDNIEISEDIVVETKNGDIKYSDQWEEFARTEVTEENEISEVVFSAEINGNSYKLFEVVINGDESKGEYVGDVTDKDGQTHKVYIKMESIEQDDNLSDEEMNRLYAMQEDINYIIDNLE